MTGKMNYLGEVYNLFYKGTWSKLVNYALRFT